MTICLALTSPLPRGSRRARPEVFRNGFFGKAFHCSFFFFFFFSSQPGRVHADLLQYMTFGDNHVVFTISTNTACGAAGLSWNGSHCLNNARNNGSSGGSETANLVAAVSSFCLTREGKRPQIA